MGRSSRVLKHWALQRGGYLFYMSTRAIKLHSSRLYLGPLNVLQTRLGEVSFRGFHKSQRVTRLPSLGLATSPTGINGTPEKSGICSHVGPPSLFPLLLCILIVHAWIRIILTPSPLFPPAGIGNVTTDRVFSSQRSSLSSCQNRTYNTKFHDSLGDRRWDGHLGCSFKAMQC